MRKRPINLYLILSILSVISLIALICLIIFLYKFKDNSVLLGIFSAWISIISGLLFSGVISLLVQIINDNANEREMLNRKKHIREREINILSREMSLFFSFYHDNESILIQKYKLQDSLIDGKLDIKTIHQNMKYLNVIYKRASVQNKAFIENYLLISKSIREQYNKVVELLNKKRIEFENINIDLNFEIFSESEIDTLKVIPLYAENYNDNFYTLIECFIKIIDSFMLEIDFDDNKWLSLIVLLLSDCTTLKNKNNNK